MSISAVMTNGSPITGPVEGAFRLQVELSLPTDRVSTQLLADGELFGPAVFFQSPGKLSRTVFSNRFSNGLHRFALRVTTGSGKVFTSKSVGITTLDPSKVVFSLSPTQSTLQVEEFSARDFVLQVRNSGGAVRFQSLTVIGARDSFGFKGGKFPGIGGTCRETVDGDCTLVIRFIPRSHDLVLTMAEKPVPTEAPGKRHHYVTAYRAGLSLVFQNGSTTTGSHVSLSLERALGFGPTVVGSRIKRPFYLSFPPETRVTRVSFTSQPSPMPQPSPSESSASSFPHPHSTPTPPPESLSAHSGSYRVDARDCTPRGEDRLDCMFESEFAPTAAGLISKTVFISYQVGGKEYSKGYILRGEGFLPNAARDMLVVYNTRSPASIQVKDHYLKHRPGVSGASVLALSYPSDCESNCPDPESERAPQAYLEKDIITPIKNWFASQKGSAVRHVVMMPGLPSRAITSGGGVGSGVEVQLSRIPVTHGACQRLSYRVPDPHGASCDKPFSAWLGENFSPRTYPGTLAIFTHLNMGSVEATLAYIDKIRDTYQQMATPNIVVSGRDAGRGGSQYYFEDAQAIYDIVAVGGQAMASVLEANPSAAVHYRSRSEPHFGPEDDLRDVLGFQTWGANGRLGGLYPTNGQFRFSGNSGWYAIQTVESFNGMHNYLETQQGNFVQWFSQNAFGGAAYSNTPAGAVTHVDEPYLTGVNDPSFFACWEDGGLFVDCAWKSFNTHHFMAVGDPWIVR